MKLIPWPAKTRESDPYHDKLDAIWQQLEQLKSALQSVVLPEHTGEPFDIGHLRFPERRAQNVRQIRARAQAVYLGDDTVLCRALGRYKMYLSASDVGFAAHLMLEGFWEFGITEFIARHVKPGMTVLDLGANFGYYTLLMAELVGHNGRLMAFEPNPFAAKLLGRSIDINGMSRIAALDTRAIWNESGQSLTFCVPVNEPKNARVVGAGKESAGISDITVTTLALDDLPLQNVDFIKIDIEGAEQRMWSGMQEFLGRSPDVLVLLEFACGRCVDPRKTLEEMQQMFPLRYLGDDSVVRPITIDQVLARPDDWMLVLSRRALAF